MPTLVRRRLPDTRISNVGEFEIIGSLDSHGEPKPPILVQIIAGEFEDHIIGEIFIKASLQGSKVHGFSDAICRLASKCLQRGVPLGDIIGDLRHGRFEPAGQVRGHPTIKTCSSVLDLAGKWLEEQYDEEGHRRTSSYRREVLQERLEMTTAQLLVLQDELGRIDQQAP